MNKPGDKVLLKLNIQEEREAVGLSGVLFANGVPGNEVEILCFEGMHFSKLHRDRVKMCRVTGAETDQGCDIKEFLIPVTALYKKGE